MNCKRSSNILDDSSGFSLVSTLVATAILSILSVSLMTLMSQQGRSMNYLEDRMSRISFTKNLSMYLLEKAACEQSLNGVEVGADPSVVEIKKADGTVLYSSSPTSSKNKYDHLEIKKITMKNMTVGTGPSSGMVEVNVVVKSKRSTLGLSGELTLQATTRVLTDGSSNIIGCGSGGTGTVTQYNNGSNLGAHDFCSMSHVGNAEDSHFCRITKLSDGTWKRISHGTGCWISCIDF